MPISKEQKALYPKDWKRIRQEIGDRADWACETCKVKHRAVILRPAKGSYAEGVYIDPPSGAVFDKETGESVGACRGSEFPAGRMIQVICTTAHLDHDPTNNGEPGNRPNLRFLCQTHHLRHDHAHHVANASRTRAAKKATGDLFR